METLEIKSDSPAELPTGESLSHYIINSSPWLMADTMLGEAFLYGDELAEQEKYNILLGVHSAILAAEKTRSHRKGDRSDFLSIFRSLDVEGAQSMPNEEVLRLRDAVSGIILSGNSSVPGRIVQTMRVLRESGESNNSILEFLRFTACAQKKDLTPDKLAPATPSDREPSIRKKRENLYLKAFLTLGRTKESIRDALCWLFFKPDCNDIEVECGAVLPAVLRSKTVMDSDMLLAFEPHIMTFRRWLSVYRPFQPAVFVFRNVQVAQTLSALYGRKDLDIISMDELETALTHCGGKRISCVLFGNNVPDLETKLEWIERMKLAAGESLSLFLFNADHDLVSASSPMFQSLLDMIPIEARTFPAGLTCSTFPARKLLMQYRFGYGVQESEQPIRVIHYAQSEVDRKNYRLTILPFFAEMPLEEYRSGSCSFRRSYREAAMEEYSKHTGRRERHEITFVDNIVIHYTICDTPGKDGDYRIKAYITSPDGEAIKETERSLSKISPERVMEWLMRVYPYVKFRFKPNRSVRQELADRADSFLSADSTLHAFIYLTPTLDDGLPGYASDVLSYLAAAPLGEYPMRQIREDTLRSLVAMLPEDAPFTPRQVINVLRVVFKRAIEMKLCTANPALTIRDYDYEVNENLSAVRNNLGQKFLSDDQFRQAVELSLERLHKGKSVYLAVLIKLMTGLQSNCISALTWSDVVTNDEFPELTQIIVRRQCETTTGTVRRFSERANYRKIPCAAMLAQALTAEKNRQMMADGLAEEELLARPIISGKTEIDGRKIVLPSELNKLCRKLLAELKFELEPYVFPIDKNTTVEIERDFFGRDPLRETWRHHAVKYGGFEVGEINYLLGLQQQDTFSRHYCDFGNDLYQFRLMKKQNDLWEAITHAEGNI